MIFLIHYDRTAGQLVSLTPFTERAAASAAKLETEIALLSSADGHEVVLLEAADEVSLKKTHRRYFDSLDDMKTDQSANYTGSRVGALKYWYVSPLGLAWRVHSDSVQDTTYPSKEQAVAAAAFDAKEWNASTGKPTGIRVKRPDGGWHEESVFGVDSFSPSR